MFARARKSYQSTYLETASPARILDEVFTRLERDLDDASALIGVGDLGGKGAAINHAHALVTELQASLDYAAAPQLCRELHRLYGYVIDCLSRANSEVKQKPLADALKIVRTLHDGFRTATAKMAP